MAAKKGYFITFEGVDGSGKSTQAKRLATRLKAAGHQVVVTREPGGSPGAELIREIVLSGRAENLGSNMEALLFAAARADHVDHLIKPALAAGKIVISDRFYDSTRAYQAAGDAADGQFVQALAEAAAAGSIPNTTVILTLPVEAAEQRMGARQQGKDRFEADQLRAFEQRQNAFLKIAEEEPDRCLVVDGSLGEGEVELAVWEAIKGRLPRIRKRSATGRRVLKNIKPARKTK